MTPTARCCHCGRDITTRPDGAWVHRAPWRIQLQLCGPLARTVATPTKNTPAADNPTDRPTDRAADRAAERAADAA